MKIQTLLSSLALTGAMSAAHADLAYGFDAGAEGFTVNEAAAGDVSWQSEGHLRVQDITDATNVFLVLPGDAISGGWAPYAGGMLSFDARLATPIGSYWPEFGAVSLVTSGQGTLVLDIVPGDEPGVEWKTYSVKLDAATWGRDAASFANALSTLQRVEINMEAGNGAIETILVDNVRVSAVPEPSGWALALVGLVGLGVMRSGRERA